MSEEISLKRKLDEPIDLTEQSVDSSSTNGSANKSTDDSTQLDVRSTVTDDHTSQTQLDETSSPAAKKRKNDGLYENANLSLSLITLKKVIDIRYMEKSAIIEGEYDGERVLIFIEKLPFDAEIIEKLFAEPFELKKILQNDIYGSYSMEPVIENRIKTTIICPATDRHFEKYLRSQYVMIEETAERYEQITLPYLESNKFSIEWVYNILEHKQESERIVFEDADDDKGFVLIPDLKWDGLNVKKMYLVAIVRKRGIKSIRDLTGEHLPLLRNVKEAGCRAIKSKYGVDADKLQTYLHYQPSYYHLHIHFNTVQYEHPRLFIGSSHLLDTVITNLEIDFNYYKKATLPFRIKSSNSLNEYYKNRLSSLESVEPELIEIKDDCVVVESKEQEVSLVE